MDFLLALECGPREQCGREKGRYDEHHHAGCAFRRTTGVNKLAIVQDALRRSDCVAFAGDGRPDLKPALMVEPHLRFARGWLAEALSKRGEGFHPFERWSQIVDQLQKTAC
jgi:2-hydroxy-3-keto-5-methylthiopentenyl-1-phosphate phosphatase